jgi:uncharacterized membrane protein YphA (DoxX/SURF4 family)
MNILLWVLQGLLALAFLAHGWLFLFPPAAIVEQMNASLPAGSADSPAGRTVRIGWPAPFHRRSMCP